MSNFALSQVLAGLALVLDVITFQLRSRTAVLLCLVSSSTLISAHYVYLDEATSSLVVALSAARFLAATLSTHRVVRNGFLLLAFCAFAGTANAWNDVFVLLASWCATIGSFDGRDRRLREWMMAGACLFIVNDIAVGSPVATLLDSLFLVGGIIGYYRFYLRRSGVAHRI